MHNAKYIVSLLHINILFGVLYNIYISTTPVNVSYMMCYFYVREFALLLCLQIVGDAVLTPLALLSYLALLSLDLWYNAATCTVHIYIACLYRTMAKSETNIYTIFPSSCTNMHLIQYQQEVVKLLVQLQYNLISSLLESPFWLPWCYCS